MPIQKKKAPDYFMTNKVEPNFHDADTLRKFTSPEGKILPARRSGLCAKNQRKVTKAIKRARAVSLLPFRSTEY